MSAEHRELAHRLGYAGLIPFVLGCALIWLIGDRDLDQHAFVSLALSAYAGLVIAFLGGIHWGLAFARGLPSRQPLYWGVSAALLGWLGVLMSPYAGLALHDVRLHHRGRLGQVRPARDQARHRARRRRHPAPAARRCRGRR